MTETEIVVMVTVAGAVMADEAIVAEVNVGNVCFYNQNTEGKSNRKNIRANIR